MDTDNVQADRFAYEAFTLAFRIQKILESTLIPQEAKDGLARDFSHLKEKVDLLTDYRKQILLINNWAIWCPPCKEEMPTLMKYFNEHSKKGFMLIGIEAGDSKEQVADFVNNFGITFPILLDPNNKSMIAFHNDNLPSSYVVDRNGIVVLAWTGPISHTMLEKYVTPLLEQ